MRRGGARAQRRDRHDPDHRPGRLDRTRVAGRAGGRRRASARALRRAPRGDRRGRRRGGQEHRRWADGGLLGRLGGDRLRGADAAAHGAAQPRRRGAAADQGRPRDGRGDARGRRLLRHAVDHGGAAVRQGERRPDPRAGAGQADGRAAQRARLRPRRGARAEGDPEAGRGFEVEWQAAGRRDGGRAASAAPRRRASARLRRPRGRARAAVEDVGRRGERRAAASGWSRASPGSARRDSSPTPRSSATPMGPWSSTAAARRTSRPPTGPGSRRSTTTSSTRPRRCSRTTSSAMAAS